MPMSIVPKIPYVLFADDDDNTLEILKVYCGIKGWKGDFVKTPREIIFKVNENCCDFETCYDAIVADINYFNQEQDLPRITGLTAISEIREVYKNIPVIFISAYISPIIDEDIQKLNAISFDKPIDPGELFSKLEQLIRWNRAVMRNFFNSERRKNSVNFSGFARRRGDREITVPKVLSDVLQEIKTEKEESDGRKRGSLN
jgi:DNA-binding response OmpR family regulator